MSKWRIADAVAHFLYCPGMLGRRIVRHRWYHRIHLIPGRWLRWVCDRYDLSLGLTKTELHRRVDDLDEVDTTEDEFDQMWTEAQIREHMATEGFEPVEVVVPIGWRCEHVSITGYGITARPTTTLCRCEMRPIFPTGSSARA